MNHLSISGKRSLWSCTNSEILRVILLGGRKVARLVAWNSQLQNRIPYGKYTSFHDKHSDNIYLCDESLEAKKILVSVFLNGKSKIDNKTLVQF